MKTFAQEILILSLIETGYSYEDAAMLLARFLEEETELYIECMKDIRKQSYS